MGQAVLLDMHDDTELIPVSWHNGDGIASEAAFELPTLPMAASAVSAGLHHFEHMGADHAGGSGTPFDLGTTLHSAANPSGPRPSPRNQAAISLDRAVPASLLPATAVFARPPRVSRLTMLSVGATIATLSLVLVALV